LFELDTDIERNSHLGTPFCRGFAGVVAGREGAAGSG
jgi:hypothetical protein